MKSKEKIQFVFWYIIDRFDLSTAPKRFVIYHLYVTSIVKWPFDVAIVVVVIPIQNDLLYRLSAKLVERLCKYWMDGCQILFKQSNIMRST